MASYECMTPNLIKFIWALIERGALFRYRSATI